MKSDRILSEGAPPRTVPLKEGTRQMSEALEAIKRTRVIAVVRLERYDQATEVARALLEGGVTAIELTHTGSGVDAAVDALRTALGDQTQVGVGTVLAASVANASIDAGAQFVVTPV